MRVGISTRTTTGVHKLNQHYRNYRDKKFQVAELGGQGMVAGYNYYGAFGQGTSGEYRSSPVIWGGKAQRWEDLSAQGGYYGMQGVDSEGNMWMTGYNYYGSIGNNVSATIYYSSPVLIPGTWSRNRGGSDNYKTTMWKDDVMYTTGYNGAGQLGQNDTVSRSSPVEISGKWFARCVNSYYDMHAFEHGGRVWVWGSNYYGVLGTNNITSYSSPVIQYGSHQWCVYRPNCAGTGTMFGIDGGTGRLYSWGYNHVGQLGQGNVTPYSYPVQMPGNWSYLPAHDGRAGYWMCGIRDGMSYVWGSNYYGELGIGVALSNASSMILLPGTWTKMQRFNQGIQWLDGKGRMYITGYNWYTGLSAYRSSPTRVPGNYRYDPTMPFNSTNASYGGHIYSTETGKQYLMGSDYYAGCNFDPVLSSNYQSSPTLVRGDWAAFYRYTGGVDSSYWSMGIGATC